MINKVKMLVGINYLHMGRLDRLPKNRYEVNLWNSNGLGIDCLGVLIVVYKELGCVIPDYVNINYNKDWDKTKSNIYIDGFNKYFNKVEYPKLWDSIMFRIRSRIPNHTGIYIGDNKFIHSCEESKVMISSLCGAFEKMVYGYYRVKI